MFTLYEKKEETTKDETFYGLNFYSSYKLFSTAINTKGRVLLLLIN